MPTSEIRELTNRFVEQLLPVRIYLFGSFADNTYTEESDFDFYIIVHDAVSDIPAETTKAYKSIRKVKQRPVDIVLGTVSRFEARKEIPSIENEVYRKGVLLYDETSQRVVWNGGSRFRSSETSGCNLLSQAVRAYLLSLSTGG